MILITRVLAVCLLLFLAIAGARAADPAFVGTWGISAAQCKVPQEQEGAPLIIAAGRYDQHEAHCVFRDVKTKRHSWRITADCAVEGDKQVDRFKVRVDGDVLTLTRGKIAAAYKRCR